MLGEAMRWYGSGGAEKNHILARNLILIVQPVSLLSGRCWFVKYMSFNLTRKLRHILGNFEVKIP
jgi:hypothetical protein